MSHDDEDKRADQETPEDEAAAEQPKTGQAGGARQDEAQDPEVAEIEQDPSRNPPNQQLRDIKGG